MEGERGLLTAAGTPVKHCNLMQCLLDAVCYPSHLVDTHCKEHQNRDSTIALGNHAADVEARQAAAGEKVESPVLFVALDLTEFPSYSEEEQQWTQEGHLIDQDQWWADSNACLLVPKAIIPSLVRKQHEQQHLGEDNLIVQ